MSDARFWAKVDKSGDCWLWTGSLTKGYGYLGRNGKPHYAHRFSWLLHNGPIPAGMQVLHRCDTPRCVRPEHLFLGSPKDNIRDAIAKGRFRPGTSPGEKNGSAKLTAQEAKEIRRRYVAGESAPKLAADFGIGQSQAWNIGTGRSWRSA